MASVNSKNAEVLLGFVAGMSLGYGIALLFAPEAGSGTRERLRSGTLNTFDTLLARVENLLERAYNNSLVEEAAGAEQ
jgi:gas vesicle protein